MVERKRPRLAGHEPSQNAGAPQAEAANKGLRFFDMFNLGDAAPAPSAAAAAVPTPGPPVGAGAGRRKPHTGPVVISSSEEDEDAIPCLVCKNVSCPAGSPRLTCRTCFSRAIHPMCSEKTIEDYDNWECPQCYKRRRKAAKEDKKKKKEKMKEKKKAV